jgi:hypothetical protein
MRRQLTRRSCGSRPVFVEKVLDVFGEAQFVGGSDQRECGFQFSEHQGQVGTKEPRDLDHGSYVADVAALNETGGALGETQRGGDFDLGPLGLTTCLFEQSANGGNAIHTAPPRLRLNSFGSARLSWDRFGTREELAAAPAAEGNRGGFLDRVPARPQLSTYSVYEDNHRRSTATCCRHRDPVQCSVIASYASAPAAAHARECLTEENRRAILSGHLAAFEGTMNANRLVQLVAVVREDVKELALVSALNQLVSHVQQAVNTPNESTQRAADATLTSTLTKLNSAPSNDISPGLREDMDELTIDGTPATQLLGKGLAARLDDIFKSGALTIKTLDRVRVLQTEVAALDAAVTHLEQGFDGVGLEPDELAPGESIVGVTIPRETVKDGLRSLRKEIQFFEQLMVQLTECNDGVAAEPAVRSLRSSGFGIDVVTTLHVASAMATIVAGVKNALDVIAKYRDLRKKAEDIGVKPKIAEQLGEQGKEAMETALDEIEAEVSQHCKIGDEGRANEIRSAIRVKIRGVAARMERGFTFEVRTSLPEHAGAADVALATPITGLSALRFEKISGPPLLELPEADDDGPPPAEGDHPPKKASAPRRRKKPEQP